MKNDDILDLGFLSKDESFFDSVNWWEKKRLVFNLILIGIEIALMLYFLKGTLQFGIVASIIWSLLYTLVANIFFSIGWSIDILAKYYFRKNAFSEKTRFVFFVLGLLFSILLTIILYGNALSHSYYFGGPF